MCCVVFRSLVKRIAHTCTLFFVLIGYVSVNGRYFNLTYPLTEKIGILDASSTTSEKMQAFVLKHV